jgi:RNA polymerase sigma factor (sigma-70 family)
MRQADAHSGEKGVPSVDAASADELALTQQVLAHWWVRRFYRRLKCLGIDMDEAVGEAKLALLRAARGYRPELGFCFSTYASQSIRRSLAQLCKGYARKRLSKTMVSLSSAIRDGRGSLCDLIEDPRAPERMSLDHRELCDLLREAVRQLPARSRTVVEMVMNGSTLQDVGASLGVTKERARQIFIEAKDRLRSALD